MTTTNATQFRYIGVTDDCVTCQKCGKPELKSTVVLAILDADCNAEEITYYGSTCAARALSIRGGGRAVLAAARGAQERTAQAAKFAREQLAFYGLPESGQPGAAALALAGARYAEHNSRWAEGKTFAEWEAGAMGMLRRRQAEIADAALVSA
jgi:hypothetical protein